MARRPESLPRPLGMIAGLGELAFDGHEQLFYLDGEPADPAHVLALDRQGRIRWRFLEHRDWLRRLDAGHMRALDVSYSQAEGRRVAEQGKAAQLDAAIAQHVHKDDGYLHGHVVQTDGDQAVAQKEVCP